MTENEYIDHLYNRWPSAGGDAPEELVSIARCAVRDHPSSSSLWCMYGDTVQLAWDPTEQHCPVDALTAYRRAIEIDPNCAEAWEGVGFFLDVMRRDFVGAEAAFRRCIALGGTPDGYSGLARLLAETGREAAALDLLSEHSCPFFGEEAVMRCRDEIARGEWRPL